jgi:hypothetical protein
MPTIEEQVALLDAQISRITDADTLFGDGAPDIMGKFTSYVRSRYSGRYGDMARLLIRRDLDGEEKILRIGFIITGLMGLEEEFGQPSTQLWMDVGRVTGDVVEPVEPYTQAEANLFADVASEIDFLRITGCVPDFEQDLAERFS